MHNVRGRTAWYAVDIVWEREGKTKLVLYNTKPEGGVNPCHEADLLEIEKFEARHLVVVRHHLNGWLSNDPGKANELVEALERELKRIANLASLIDTSSFATKIEEPQRVDEKKRPKFMYNLTQQYVGSLELVQGGEKPIWRVQLMFRTLDRGNGMLMSQDIPGKIGTRKVEFLEKQMSEALIICHMGEAAQLLAHQFMRNFLIWITEQGEEVQGTVASELLLQVTET